MLIVYFLSNISLVTIIYHYFPLFHEMQKVDDDDPDDSDDEDPDFDPENAYKFGATSGSKLVDK